MLPILPILLGVVGVATRAVGTIPTLLRKAAAPAVAAVVGHATAQPDGPPQRRRRRLPKLLSRAMYAGVILMFLWEVVGRMILIPIFAPELLLRLPPSMLDQVMELLMTMPVE